MSPHLVGFATRVLLVSWLTGCSDCERPPVPSAGCGDMHMRVRYRLPDGVEHTACSELYPMTSPGIHVSKHSNWDCRVQSVSASADEFGTPSLFITVISGEAWYERDGRTRFPWMVDVSPRGPPGCAPDDFCVYRSSCPAQVNVPGMAAGDLVEAQILPHCVIDPWVSGFPEGVVLEELVIRGPLQTTTAGDAGIVCR